MQVRDNGGGLQVRTLRALRTGVGLANTRDRLDCLYGRLYRLEFSDRDGGLSVLIEIPFQRVAAPGAAAAAFRVA
jgi:signal transduction histidine kinase